jgi:hypothetical protein
LQGDLAVKAGTQVEEYEMTIIVKKKINVPRYTLATYLLEKYGQKGNDEPKKTS